MWIKGSPTFKGLKYALNEPESRFYIGSEPEIIKKIRSNKTKYIKSLNIFLSGEKDSKNLWFDNIVIPLNSELVTIIGNKGSGKSAVSDIIALCCDAENSEDYSFLKKDKFLQKKLAERYSSKITLESGNATDERKLDYKIDQSSQRKIKYLPQSYFERICNEVGKVEAFRKEIEKVVFQYVPEHRKLGKNTFNEFIDFKKDSLEREMCHIKENIEATNKKIINIEDDLSPENLKNLKSRLSIKEEEYKVHLESKPELVEENIVNSEAHGGEAESPMQMWEGVRDKAILDIEVTNKDVVRMNVNIEELGNLKSELTQKKLEFDNFIIEKLEIFKKYGFESSSLIKIEYDITGIEGKIKELRNERDAKLQELIQSPDFETCDINEMNLASREKRADKEILEILSKLGVEERLKQERLGVIADWSKQEKQIKGSPEIADSILFLKSNIEYIEKAAATDLDEQRRLRRSYAEALFIKRSEIKVIYDDIKTEIDSILNKSEVTNLSIVSDFNIKVNIEDALLLFIKQNRMGTFYGVDDGKLYLTDKIISAVDWNSLESVLKFQDLMIESLENDFRDPENVKKTYIGDTVKNREKLYDFLYGLDFLEAHYNLKQNDKNLEQLSPGEKGALLLVFYLVLDKDDIPLLIDQPEDNLDNSSVASVLVPFIRQAKKTRQIILVTHNPNLAVVADSEQVIRVSIDKVNGNIFSFISGGIEDTEINNAIVEVLEGDIPAFKERKNKYEGI